jgi:glycine C-acetyltransferase
MGFGGQSVATQFLNAYSLLIPQGERFIIRTCRRYLDRAGPELKEELRCLFFQEGSHSREHARMVEDMHAEGLGLKLFRRLVEGCSYRLFEPISPPALRLAAAAAIEHHNAAIATFFLRNGLLQKVRPVEIRRLFLWHFAEEIEHQETVFRLLERVSSSWWLRAFGLCVSCATFLFYLALGTLLLALKTRTAMAVAFWRELLAQCRDREGLFGFLVRESVRYLKPSFYPRLDESRVLLDSALVELERLGVEQPTTRSAASSNTLPAAFREKMAPVLDRVRKLQSGNPFLSACIRGYDGAWVQTEEARKLNFCTYSYLGLLRHPRIREAATRAIEDYGTGTHGVRLLGGNLDIHETLEAKIAGFFQREAAIVFSSGFMTNLAVIAALVGRGDHVLSDKHNHASIVDGCRLSGAQVTRFRHNDMEDLANRLRRLPAGARKLIVVDAVYSMDGDIAPLDALLTLRDGHPNTLLMVDEAHSLGVLGGRGRGIEEHFHRPGQIDVLMGTLSKTIPAQGGYIAGSQELITFLRFSARGFVFSAALPPATAAAAMAALEVIETEGPSRRARLMSNVDYFMRRLRESGFNMGNSASAIVPILLGDESLALEMARRCNLAGVYVMPVTYPAVAKGTERLRMNVTSDHQPEDLEFAVRILVAARAALGESVEPWFSTDVYVAQI